MFLVLVKVSPIMSLSYMESQVPEKDCNHSSRKTVAVFLLSLLICFQETHKNAKLLRQVSCQIRLKNIESIKNSCRGTHRDGTSLIPQRTKLKVDQMGKKL